MVFCKICESSTHTTKASGGSWQERLFAKMNMWCTTLSQHHHYLPCQRQSSTLFKPLNTINTSTSPKLITITTSPNNFNSNAFLTNLLSFSLSLSITLSSPLPSLALPSFLNSKSLSPTTPFSQSKKLPLGLENGKIRACPSVNPGCVTTNPKSSNFEFPWEIPSNSTDNPLQKLQGAILSTQKNAKIQVVEDTPSGQYLQAEVDGGFGRDIMEFLINGDVVAYRCMAAKVTYVYPFTTAFGDSKGQQERMKKIVEELGWYAPSIDLMD